jgi:hypothetical protein
MSKFILDQDRIRLIWLYPNCQLSTRPALYNGKAWGINLYAGKQFLGTFDTVGQAIREMRAIQGDKALIHKVAGYCPPSDDLWKEWRPLVECMKEGESSEA